MTGNAVESELEKGVFLAMSQGNWGFDTKQIRAGYDADLILLDFDRPNLIPCHSVYDNLVYSAHGSDVVMNMARGRVIYRNGAFFTIDLERVKQEIAAYAIPKLFG